MQDKPNFEAAVTQFQELLGISEYARKIAWLMPEDVIVTGKRFVYVRVPVPTGNEMAARQMYEEGLSSGRGLLISTLCEMEDSTCCYIWYPKGSEKGHQGLWPGTGSIKVTAKTNSSRIPGKPVRSRLRWKILALRYKAKQGLKAQLFG